MPSSNMRIYKMKIYRIYKIIIWDFKRTDVNALTTAINQVDWKFMFYCKNVQQQ